MKIVSYNCKNFRANFAHIKSIIDNNDICFFIEHWLGEEDAYLFNNISNDHSIIFLSDYSHLERDLTRKKGRPHVGKCWVIRNNYRVVSFENLNSS